MNSKLSKNSLLEIWKKKEPKSQSEFCDKICEILHDYGLRMSGQSHPISETLEETKKSLVEYWQEPKRALDDTLVDCLLNLRSQHPDIWMNNTDALKNPKLDSLMSVNPKQKKVMIKAESYLNRLYPHAKELILLRLWFELDFHKIDFVLEEQTGMTEKLYQQAIQHLANNLNQSENVITQTLINLPLHEKPIYTRNETQDITMLMDGYSKVQKQKKYKLYTRIFTVVVVLGLGIAYYLMKAQS